jgi:hypothetical protein
MEETITPEEMRRAMAYAGSRRTARKAATSAENGKKGGRPARALAEIPCTCGRGDAVPPEQHPTTCQRGLAARRRRR